LTILTSQFSNMIVKYLPKSDLFELPKRGSLDAACFDCKATSVKYIGDDTWEFGLGFATSFSESNWKGIIVPRSSFTKTDFVMKNSPAQVDSDYRGEWLVRFSFVGDRNNIIQAPYQVGDRICQIYFEKVNQVAFEVVKDLTDTERQSGGFGSTGK